MLSPSLRALAAALILTLLAGCTSGSSDEAESTSTTTGATSTLPGASAMDTNPFVQDLWIYERLRTVNSEGEIVDHTARLVESIAGFEAGEPVELVTGFDFVPVPEIGAHLKGDGSEPRPDASAVAGFVESEFGTAFAVLGTVDADGERQIGRDDRVFADLSFLGDAMALGDVVSADLVLVQLMPTDDPAEVEMDALDLASHRARAARLQYTADDDGDVAVIEGQLGRIVAGSEGPELPVKSSDELESSIGDGLRKCRRDMVQCVSRVLDSIREGGTKNFEQNMDQLDPPEPPDEPFNPLLHLPQEPPPPPCQSPPCGRAIGDPHLTTFDGHAYGMHAVGEFVLARHDAAEVEIQIRTSPVNDQVSQVARVAVGVGDEVVIVGADHVLLGDDLLPADSPARYDGPDFTLTTVRGSTTIETASGHVVSLQRASRGHIDVVVDAESADGGWVGLLGDADGAEDNDLVASDGTAFDLTIGFDDLYQEFVTSWRVTDESSLFDYPDGESTETFTDLRHPLAPVSLDDFDSAERLVAEAVCRLVGVESPAVMRSCAIDFLVTGDIDYLRSARLNQAVDNAITGAGDSQGDGPAERARMAWDVSGENLLGIGGDAGSATHLCPPMPAGETFPVWGDGIYHGGSSSVCAAAVHAGVIDAETGGTLTVTTTMAEAGVTYEGVERHGIRSSTWAGNSWGFVTD